MSEVTYKFIGWNNTDTHDKVWVNFRVGPHAYAAWAGRGHKIQFKNHGVYAYKLDELERKKRKDGYKEVDEFVLFTVFPDFKEQLEKELSFAMLAGKIK
jgi:hypothetical protein